MQQPINNNKQQTAVDIFFFEIKRYNIGNNQYLINKEDLEKLELQAKEMEKEQMENLWDAAISHGGCKCYDEIMTFEEYYKETFNQ